MKWMKNIKDTTYKTHHTEPGRFPRQKGKIMKKYYVIRINKQTNEKQYMKTKCVGGWLTSKTNCWQFSKQGAKGIVERYSKYTHPIYALYDYDIEAVTE